MLFVSGSCETFKYASGTLCATLNSKPGCVQVMIYQTSNFWCQQMSLAEFGTKSWLHTCMSYLGRFWPNYYEKVSVLKAKFSITSINIAWVIAVWSFRSDLTENSNDLTRGDAFVAWLGNSFSCLYMIQDWCFSMAPNLIKGERWDKYLSHWLGNMV